MNIFKNENFQEKIARSRSKTDLNPDDPWSVCKRLHKNIIKLESGKYFPHSSSAMLRKIAADERWLDAEFGRCRGWRLNPNAVFGFIGLATGRSRQYPGQFSRDDGLPYFVGHLAFQRFYTCERKPVAIAAHVYRPRVDDMRTKADAAGLNAEFVEDFPSWRELGTLRLVCFTRKDAIAHRASNKGGR